MHFYHSSNSGFFSWLLTATPSDKPRLWLWLLLSYTDHGPRDRQWSSHWIHIPGSRGVQSGAHVRRAAGVCHGAYVRVRVRAASKPGRVWCTYRTPIPGSGSVCNGVCLRHVTGPRCGAYAASRVHMHAVYLMHAVVMVKVSALVRSH